MQLPGLAQRPTGGSVTGLVLRPSVVALLVVPEIPTVAGVYELSGLAGRAQRTVPVPTRGAQRSPRAVPAVTGAFPRFAGSLICFRR